MEWSRECCVCSHPCTYSLRQTPTQNIKRQIRKQITKGAQCYLGSGERLWHIMQAFCKRWPWDRCHRLRSIAKYNRCRIFHSCRFFVVCFVFTVGGFSTVTLHSIFIHTEVMPWGCLLPKAVAALQVQLTIVSMLGHFLVLGAIDYTQHPGMLIPTPWLIYGFI